MTLWEIPVCGQKCPKSITKVITDEQEPLTCSKLHKAIDFKLLMRLRQDEVEESFAVRRLGLTHTLMPWNPSDIAFGKCTAVVRFKVNRPINIDSLGFFGPHEIGGRGKYHMEISILTENYCEIASSTQVTPVIRDGEVFHVKFDSPVPLLPCLWYMAKFSMLGPPTAQCLKVASSVTVDCGDFGKCRFTFEMPDSYQLPEIRFSIRA